MGDRCYVEIKVRKSDLEAWESLDYALDECSEETDPGVAAMIDTERNYGVDSDDLAAGCPMVGWSGSGRNYGPAVFAFDGDTFMEHDSLEDGRPAIACGIDGPSAEDLAKAKEFVAFYRKVEAMLRPAAAE